jgi:hypothetical protein
MLTKSKQAAQLEIFLLFATIWLLPRRRLRGRKVGQVRLTVVTLPTVNLKSTLTCPHCGHATLEEMSLDSCRFFHQCVQCHAPIRPKVGDCCVFCSYGSVNCPPMQLQGRSRNG